MFRFIFPIVKLLRSRCYSEINIVNHYFVCWKEVGCNNIVADIFNRFPFVIIVLYFKTAIEMRCLKFFDNIVN